MAHATRREARFKIREGSGFGLQLFKEVTEISNVPVLRTIAGIAVLISEMTEGTTKISEDSHRLAQYSCEILSVVLNELGSGKDFTPELAANMESLQSAVEGVLRFLQVERKRSYFQRLIHQKMVADLVKEHTERLQHAFALFTLRSQLQMRTGLEEIMPRQEDRQAKTLAALESYGNAIR